MAFCVMVGVGAGTSASPLAGTSTAATGLVESSAGWLSTGGVEIGTACPGSGVGLDVVPLVCAGGGAVVVVCGSVVVGAGLVVVVVGLVVVVAGFSDNLRIWFTVWSRCGTTVADALIVDETEVPVTV